MNTQEKMSGIFVLLLFLVPGIARAGEEVRTRYEREALRLEFGLLGNAYIRNGQRHSVGIFGGSLKKAVAGSPQAVVQMERYARLQAAAWGSMAVGTGTWLVGKRIKDDHRAADRPPGNQHDGLPGLFHPEPAGVHGPPASGLVLQQGPAPSTARERPLHPSRL